MYHTIARLGLSGHDLEGPSSQCLRSLVQKTILSGIWGLTP